MKNKILVTSFESLTAKSAGGIGHLGYKLAETLHRRGLLKEFVCSAKGKWTTSFPSSPVSFSSRYYLFALHKLEKILGIKVHQSRYLQELAYDWFCSFHLDPGVGVLVSTTPYLHHTFKKAAKMGVRIYLIPGNPEDNYIADLVREENQRYGISEDDAYTHSRRLAYYNKSLPLVHHIITYSALMEETYRRRGYDKKLIGVRGYLKPDFATSAQRVQGERFKVAFLAFTVLLKGLQYLLEAWKELQHLDMELHIGGPIDENVQQLIRKEYSDLKHVVYTGRVTDIPAFFADKDVYVLSSIIDGAPVTILEAMHCGVPVIVSDNCGTKDIVEEGTTGWIVPFRNHESIRDRILEAYHHRAETAEMGKRAQEKIDGYDMQVFTEELADIVAKGMPG